MHIQIHSDLHIEKLPYDNVNGLDFITPKSEILVLCGDIGSIYKFSQLKFFFSSICKYFKKIFYVPGNNEFYNIINKPLEFNILKNKLKSLQDFLIIYLYLTNLSILSITLFSVVVLCGAISFMISQNLLISINLLKKIIILLILMKKNLLLKPLTTLINITIKLLL